MDRFWADSGQVGQILVGLGDFWAEYFIIYYFPIYLWETLRSPNWVGDFGRVWEIMGEYGGIPNLTYQNVTQWHYLA